MSSSTALRPTSPSKVSTLEQLSAGAEAEAAVLGWESRRQEESRFLFDTVGQLNGCGFTLS